MRGASSARLEVQLWFKVLMVSAIVLAFAGPARAGAGGVDCSTCGDGDACTDDGCIPDSNCCVPNGGLGCDDAACQATVCAADPFCCDVEWDSICAGEAASLCAGLCSVGTCTHTPVVCDDGNLCTENTCDPSAGCVYVPTDCDDDDACTDDGCTPSNCCVASGGLGCDDAECQATVCGADPFCCDVAWDGICADEAAGLCGNLCTGAASCTHTPVQCDDGDACTDDTCDPDTGCVYTQVECDDEDACTEDGCDSATGCTHTPIRCGDGDPCTEDICDPDKGCVSTPIDCDDGNACTEDACSVGASNCCVPNGGLGCDDATCQATVCGVDPFCCDVSWDDICAGEAADLCGGLCSMGSCTHTLVRCGDGDACTTDSCDPDTGCVYAPVDCDDGDACTDDACTPGLSNCCVDNGGLGCNDADCQAMVCAADPFCCDTAWDGICADEAASLCGDLCGGLSNCCEANGGLGCDDAECQAAVCAVDPFCCDTAWDGICADEAVSLCGDLCGGGGGCTHTPVECDDDDPCTQDSCDPDTGCVNTPVDCNDEDACTDDSCSAGVGDSDCCVGHRGPGCDDAACEAAVCGADPGCCVGDGNWDVTCAGLAASLCADLCSGAVCMHTPVDCDDGDACTDDGCDPASGCTHTPIRCGDGSTCTEDSCDPDTGCVNTPIDCDDGDACTVDACSPGLSNCCVPNGGLGCDEAGCQATVCATDPFCCDTAWDDVCADEAASLCGDLCDAIVSSTCCVPNGGLGCDDARCQAAVCAIDPFCCDTAWDGICAEEAASLCGDLCRGIVGSSNCCEGHGGLGCDDAACQATVCGVDPFCCDVAWDGICAGEAESLCQELCFGSPGGCTYTPVDCDDDNACTEDSCDSATGCAYTPIECDDGNACTADSCDPDTGCVSTFIDGCVDLDIKPGSCPNAFVRGVVGLLPVSLTGSADFDLALIDQSSLLLSRADGVGGDLAPSGISIRDQATPYAGPLCGCHTLTTDGWVDLNLTFKNAAVTTAFQLNSLSLGQNVTLQVTGTFVDGTPFSASDCIRLQGMISPVVPPHN